SDVVEPGTYEPGTDSPVAAVIFDNVPDLTEVVIEPQTITLTYDNDIEADLMLRRAQRPVVNAVLNTGSTITGEVVADREQTLRFITTDESWQFGRYVPALIADGENEIYETREDGMAGSPLAQYL